LSFDVVRPGYIGLLYVRQLESIRSSPIGVTWLLRDQGNFGRGCLAEFALANAASCSPKHLCMVNLIRIFGEVFTIGVQRA